MVSQKNSLYGEMGHRESLFKKLLNNNHINAKLLSISLFVLALYYSSIYIYLETSTKQIPENSKVPTKIVMYIILSYIVLIGIFYKMAESQYKVYKLYKKNSKKKSDKKLIIVSNLVLLFFILLMWMASITSTM